MKLYKTTFTTLSQDAPIPQAILESFLEAQQEDHYMYRYHFDLIDSEDIPNVSVKAFFNCLET